MHLHMSKDLSSNALELSRSSHPLAWTHKIMFYIQASHEHLSSIPTLQSALC